MFFTPGYVEGGGTGILATSFLDAMDPMFNDDIANPGCWMQKQATWYGPDPVPRCRRPTVAATPSTSSARTSGSSTSRRSTRRRARRRSARGDAFMVTRIGPEVRALAQYLSLPEGIKGWIAPR